MGRCIAEWVKMPTPHPVMVQAPNALSILDQGEGHGAGRLIAVELHKAMASHHATFGNRPFCAQRHRTEKVIASEGC